MTTSTCRSCGALILWAVTEAGKRMPVDADRVPDGNIVLRHIHVGEPPIVMVTTPEERELLAEQAATRGEEFRLFVSHFATCPNAAKHRAPKEEPMATATITSAPLSALRLDEANPRTDIDPAGIHELAASIKQHGILQPLLVRPDGDGYLVVAGQRRLLAAIEAGLDEAPVFVRDTNGDSATVAIVENLQREELNPLEQAHAFRKAIDSGMAVDELADALNVGRQLISGRLALLELPEGARNRIGGEGGLTLRAAALLPVLAAAGETVVEKAAELIAEGVASDQWGDPVTADDLEHDPAGVLETVLNEMDQPPFFRHVRKGGTILPTEVDWPDGCGVNGDALKAKLERVPRGYDPRTYRDHRQSACIFAEEDIDAARAYGCLVELASGRHDVQAWISDPAWLGDRLDQKLDKAIKSHERKAKAEAKKAGAQEPSADAANEAAAAKRAANAAARAAMLSARERNLTLGRALYKELHAPAIVVDGMRAIAELIVDYAGDDLGQRGLRYVDESAQTVTTKKNGEISKLAYPRTQQQCKDLVRRQLGRAKSPEQIYGFLLQLLVAGRFAEVGAAPPSDRWGSIRSLDSYAPNRALVALVEKIAEPVLPPAVVEQLRERQAKEQVERGEEIGKLIVDVRGGRAVCPSCGHGRFGVAVSDFVPCACTDAEMVSAFDSCPRCGEADCEASCSGFDVESALDGSDDLTETETDADDE